MARKTEEKTHVFMQGKEHILDAAACNEQQRTIQLLINSFPALQNSEFYSNPNQTLGRYTHSS